MGAFYGQVLRALSSLVGAGGLDQREQRFVWGQASEHGHLCFCKAELTPNPFFILVQGLLSL